MNHKRYLACSALIFAAVALMHLVRAVKGWSFAIGPLSLPVWFSWIGACVTASLSAWGLRLARR